MHSLLERQSRKKKMQMLAEARDSEKQGRNHKVKRRPSQLQPDNNIVGKNRRGDKMLVRGWSKREG